MNLQKEEKERLVKQFSTLWYNGFGFQFNAEKKEFYPIRCSENVEKDLGKIMTETGALVSFSDFLGRSFLTINFLNHDKIEAVLNKILELGHSFVTNNGLQVHFSVGETFSIARMERKYIRDFKEKLNANPKILDFLVGTEDDRLLAPWNWTTPEGKEFSQFLQDELLHRKTTLEDYTQWPIFSENHEKYLYTFTENEKQKRKNESERNSENKRLKSNSSSSSSSESEKEKNEVEKVKEENDELEECMICFDKPPDTMVLPCEHCVVCRDCSVKLKNTNDHHTCLRCRRSITHILD